MQIRIQLIMLIPSKELDRVYRKDMIKTEKVDKEEMCLEVIPLIMLIPSRKERNS